MRKTLTIQVNLALQWPIIHHNLKSLPIYCILNSNVMDQEKKDKYSHFEFLVGIDAVEEMPNTGSSFEDLHKFYEKKKDWVFGYFSYDLKNEVENLSSENSDRINFPLVHFYRPRYVIRKKGNTVQLEYLPEYNSAEEASLFIENLLQHKAVKNEVPNTVSVISTVNRDEYISTVNKIKEHISRGDIYEMNYCTEFFAEDIQIDPVEVYQRMNMFSPMPFSSVYKLRELYALCASPERFLAKRKDKIISQPIKGTARRGATKEEDDHIIEQLANDPKERAENVMIVDLVRNDLSRSAKKGSVQVEELFGIYSFQRLHQMISTIVSEKREDVDAVTVLRDAFPMGSMTGAPKVRAMQLIEEFEKTRRGLYSGAIGYLDPSGDFDFNVVIRTILYNSAEARLSFMVGSAITANADPEKEFAECLLKAESMKRALSGIDN